MPDPGTDDSASDYTLDLIDPQGNKQTVKVNMERVKEGIVTLAAGEGGGRFQLTAELLNAIRTANPDSIVEFQLPAAAFKLPLGELDLQERLAAAGLEGSQWHLEVVAQQMDSSDEAGLNSGFQTDKLSQPVRFQLFIADGEGKSVPVTAFDSYVERTITVDKTDIPDSASAVWFDEQGEYRFAPATFEAANGQTTVTIKSKGTGTFALIQHPVSFPDMDQHWAEQAVNLLASKMVVQGRDAEGFDPKGAIT
ncbi:hypothetical protein K0U00_42475, partial [Paenibacillus sepulcri]|nr:hypothetical protein [Paenibacillus sepulcri]